MSCDLFYIQTEKIGDLKPYQIDRTVFMEYIPGHSKDDFWMICQKCFHEQAAMDEIIYKANGTKVPTVTWDDPLGKLYTN